MSKFYINTISLFLACGLVASCVKLDKCPGSQWNKQEECFNVVIGKVQEEDLFMEKEKPFDDENFGKALANYEKTGNCKYDDSNK